MVRLVSFIILISSINSMGATDGQRLWSYLNGTNLSYSDPTIIEMDKLIHSNSLGEASRLARFSPKSLFVINRVKSTFIPFGGREVSTKNPIGDFTLTMMMGVKNNIPLRELFLSNIRFVTKDAIGIENESTVTSRIDARMSKVFSDADLDGTEILQTDQSYLMPEGHLGVLTSLQYGRAVFEAGTNRRAVKRIVEDFLCVGGIEHLVSYKISDAWVGRDVERTPGGSVATYLNKCVGCHAGMDGIRGAFASYSSKGGNLYFSEGFPDPKMNSNPLNFTGGYFVKDSKWQHLGWLPTSRQNIGKVFDGPKALITMLLAEPEFYQCLVKRAANAICPERSLSMEKMKSLSSSLMSHQNLGDSFAEVAENLCLN